jgi:6-phosphofructokinase 2
VTGHIVSLTLSPALDISTHTDTVAPAHKLRCGPPDEHPGGGGINVARVAARLGESAIAVAPLGGASGSRLAVLAQAEGVAISAVATHAATRESFSVFEDSTRDQYRFVLPAPDLSEDEFSAALQTTIDESSDASCVVVSGQIPRSLPNTVLSRVVSAVAPVPVLVDTSGAALDDALASGAHLVKPSARELSSIVGRDLVTEHDILEAAREVCSKSNVGGLIVSIGAGGAFAVRPDEDPVRLRAPTVRVRSAIGAGDAMVAGIAVGLARERDVIDAVRLGVAAGTAAVLTSGTELCEADRVAELLRFVTSEPALN